MKNVTEKYVELQARLYKKCQSHVTNAPKGIGLA